MNKKILLISLILIASCFGILGMVEKSNADGVDVEIHFFEVNENGLAIGEVASVKAGDEIIIQVMASPTNSAIKKQQFEIDINGSTHKCYDEKCPFGTAGGSDKCACGIRYSFSSNGNYKVTGTVYSNSGRSYSESKTITIGNVPSALPIEPATTTSTTPTTVSESSSSVSGATVNLPTKKLSEILEDLIKWLLKIVILIAILMIIVSGAMYMISAGDQTKTDTAKKALTYAIMGLLVVGLAYAIVNTLVDILAG